MKPIREDEWRHELERVLWASDDGLTARELAKLLKLSLSQVRKRLQALQESGRLISGRKHVEAIDGTMRTSAVYQLAKKRKP